MSLSLGAASCQYIKRCQWTLKGVKEARKVSTAASTEVKWCLKGVTSFESQARARPVPVAGPKNEARPAKSPGPVPTLLSSFLVLCRKWYEMHFGICWIYAAFLCMVNKRVAFKSTTQFSALYCWEIQAAQIRTAHFRYSKAYLSFYCTVVLMTFRLIYLSPSFL